MAAMSTLPAAIAIRWFAHSQAFAVVVIHAIWILLAVGFWNDAAATGPALGLAMDKARAALVWLGALSADGRANEESVWAAWLKLSLPLYLLGEAWRAARGDRPPVHWWLPVVCSTAAAVAGFALALSPERPAMGEMLDSRWLAGATAVLAAIVIATTLATTWAVLAHRLGEWAIRAIEANGGITGLLESLTHHAPARRPQTASTPLESRHFPTGEPVEITTPQGPPPPAALPRQRAIGCGTWLLIIAAMVLAYVGAVAMFWIVALLA